jgi:hypothetical protein
MYIYECQVRFDFAAYFDFFESFLRQYVEPDALSNVTLDNNHSFINVIYASFPYYHIGDRTPLRQIGFDKHIMTVVLTNQIYAVRVFTYKSQRFELLFQK